MAARTIWYDNPQVLGWHGRIDRHPNSFRWGGLIERVQNCQFGYWVDDEEPAGRFLTYLRAAFFRRWPSCRGT